MNSSTQRRKRHCMVVFAYYPLAETRVQRQAEALIEQGYEVDVICIRSKRQEAFEDVRGVKVYRLPVKRSHWLSGFAGRFVAYIYFFILAALKLIPLHLKNRYGVVQVHNLPDFLVFCTLFPKLLGAKTILDIHDVMPEFFAEEIDRPMNSGLVKLMTWQEQTSCWYADHVITVTELWRQSLIERGVADEKSSVVMNLADHRMFHSQVRPQRNGDSANGTFRLIYHGVQAYRHGLDTLLRAVAKIRDQAPDLRVTLHGSGDYHDDLVRIADELQLNDQVQFSTTFMPLDDLPGFVAQADAGVVPYQNEVFTGGILPTKLLEYTALGMPNIAARTPAIETYFDDKMVKFFEPGNVDQLAECILELYKNKEVRAQLVAESARFNEEHNWPAESANYAKLIDRLNGYQ